MLKRESLSTARHEQVKKMLYSGVGGEERDTPVVKKRRLSGGMSYRRGVPEPLKELSKLDTVLKSGKDSEEGNVIQLLFCLIF